MPADPVSSLATVLDFERRTVELVADEVRSIPEGWLARTPSLPEVWFLNGVWAESRMPYEDLVALCDRHRGAAAYDQLYLDDQAGGEALAPSFDAAAWEVEVEVQLVLTGAPDREVETTDVIEPHQEESLALMERWISEDETLHLSPDGVLQLVEANRRTWSARDVRGFGVRGAAGELQGTTLLYSDGPVAQVENVYVVPEARGRGYARAMVSAAASAAGQAGHQLIFIVADDNDWPKQLYVRLGFQPVGRRWLLQRDRRSARSVDQS